MAHNGQARAGGALAATRTDRWDEAADPRRTRGGRDCCDEWILCRSNARSLTVFGGSGGHTLIRNELEHPRVVVLDYFSGRATCSLVNSVDCGVPAFFCPERLLQEQPRCPNAVVRTRESLSPLFRGKHQTTALQAYV